MALSTEPVRIADRKLRPIGYVEEDGRYYKAVIQLGASRSWRTYSGGKWEKDVLGQAAARDGETVYKHVARVHVTEPIPSWILNGLISEHNSFLNANGSGSQRDRSGDIGRMLVVTGYEECPAPKMKTNLPAGFEQMMAGIAAASAQEATKAVMSALLDAGLIGTDKASGKAKRGAAASGESGSLPLGDSGN
jgi:hypothetical protein